MCNFPFPFQSGIDKLSSRMLIGIDYFPIPVLHQHLTVLELSHRHSVPQLQATYDALTKETAQAMTNIPSSLPKCQTIRLVKPFLSFDEKAVAVTFVPDASNASYATNGYASDEDDKVHDSDHFTYQHLRSEMHKLAMKSGIKIDTCYTTATAHITLGRFIGDSVFAPSSVNHDADGANDDDTQTRTRNFVKLVQEINKELESSLWGEDGMKWVIAGDKGLECQFGYVKWGRVAQLAANIGKTVEK
jgi:hypothetical protein